MSEEIVVSEGKPGKRTGSVNPPLNGDFAKWLERQFRGGEQPQSVDVYPLHKGRDREQCLGQHAIKEDDKIRAERAVELSNEIFSDCQIHCDGLPRTSLSKENTKTYEVTVIDSRRGGLAKPVGSFLLKLMPRIHQPAPDPDEDVDDLSSEDGDALTARKMILEVHRENNGRQERLQIGTLNVAGDVMMLLKDSLKDSFVQNRELHTDIRGMMSEFRQMVREEGQRRVEEKAVGIDAANAEVEREFRRATLMKENMWTNVMQAGMLEGVKVLGHLFPGFGQLFSALLQGKTPPPPPGLPGAPQIPSSGTTPGGTNGQPQLPAVSEKTLIDRFVDTAEKTKLNDTHTIAEKLFGKDENGKTVEEGIFTREQVSILTGIHVGTVPIETLDGLLPGSGKSEELQGLQMAKAMAILTPEMVADISKILEMRKAAKK